MRNDSRLLPLLRRTLLPLFVLGAAACSDDTPLQPDAGDGGNRPAPGSRALGVMEITISGIGTPSMSASALPVRPGAELASGASFSLTPVEESGKTGIQLAPLSTGSFTHGERGKGGVRYIHATYRVRNASRDGTPYTTPRENLTFLATSTERTLGETAISRLYQFDGTAAAIDPASILPAGAAVRDPYTGGIKPVAADVLELFTEDEIANLVDHAPAGVTSIFPYGFVVKNAGSSSTRTLGADPATDQFDGIVTFAFKVPLTTSPGEDPFTLSAVFTAVDQDDVVITQSYEEQTRDGKSELERRAAGLNAARINLLGGGEFDGLIPTRFLCRVRTAGAAGSATAYLGQPATPLVALSPAPNTPQSRTISPTARFSATLSRAVDGADANTFVVRGLQSGQRFRGAPYTGNGTATIATPAASLFAGEEVEVVLTRAFSTCPGGDLPYLARYRVATQPSNADFSAPEYLLQPQPDQILTTIPADLNGDGRLDLLVVHDSAGALRAVINDGAMAAPATYVTHLGHMPLAAAVGDLDGDGIPDVVVGFRDQHQVVVHPGNGDGTFLAGAGHTVGGNADYIALGDLNGDGHLDVVTASKSALTISVLLNRGDGTFQPAVSYASVGEAYGLVLADLNGDGKLDLATTHHDEFNHLIPEREDPGINTTIRLGNGRGGFEAVSVLGHDVGPREMTAADLNGDGIADLVVAAWFMDPRGRNWLNFDLIAGNREGHFAIQKTQEFRVDAWPRSIAAGDINGDGALDLVISSWINRLHVLTNDGTGTLQFRAHTSVQYSGGASLGDLDGDGTLDIVAHTDSDDGRYYNLMAPLVVHWNR
jgi:hypothetical protein